MTPAWLHILAIASLSIGFLCAAVIATDELRHPQHMWIMNIVWPVVALFGTALTVWGYFKYGRLASKQAATRAKEEGKELPGKEQTPFPIIAAKGASHCGSGCTLGDIAAEWLAFAFPAVALGFGWRALFEEKIFAAWIFDYILAFIFGIAFQYFTIAPMRGLGPLAGLKAALKADALSLTAWQIGMYAFMAFAYFFLFGELIGARLEVNSFEFWFMMQIAMICGFITSYPINWILIRRGIKEKM